MGHLPPRPHRRRARRNGRWGVLCSSSSTSRPEGAGNDLMLRPALAAAPSVARSFRWRRSPQPRSMSVAQNGHPPDECVHAQRSRSSAVPSDARHHLDRPRSGGRNIPSRNGDPRRLIHGAPRMRLLQQAVVEPTIRSVVQSWGALHPPPSNAWKPRRAPARSGLNPAVEPRREPAAFALGYARQRGGGSSSRATRPVGQPADHVRISPFVHRRHSGGPSSEGKAAK